jgi:hypothetical protein
VIPGEAEQDLHSSSVSLNVDESVVAIGASNGSSTSGRDQGYVRVYEYVADTWIQRGGDLGANPVLGKEFDHAVVISHDGNVVAVGDFLYESPANKGSVSVFNYDGQIWRLRANVTVGASNDFMGFSVSLSGDGSIILLGAPRFLSGDPGHASVFRWLVGLWVRLGPSLSGEEGHNGNFGYSVGISANVVSLQFLTHPTTRLLSKDWERSSV